MKAAIEDSFGSFEEFQKVWNKHAVSHFGSGWVWLVKFHEDGRLRVGTGHDAANPLRDGVGVPILTCDVWEHAYYIDYRNSRPNYLESWWKVVNWDFANQNMEAATRQEE